MNLSQKLNRRIFAGLGVSLLLSAGLIVFSVFYLARPNQSGEVSLNAAPEKQSKAQEEQSKRAEGLRFRRLSLQDEKGVIDPNGLRKAKEQIEKMKKVQPERRRQRQGQIQEAGIAPDSWTSLGPGNIGGRIRSISINPDDADDMLIGSVSGGIWRTLNGGDVWFPAADFMANLAVSTIARSPTNPNIIYAGTGEGFGNIDFIQGAGIFRSFDGGGLWFPVDSTNNPNFNFVNRLAFAPNGAAILAATNTGVWRSDNNGASWSQRTVNTMPNTTPDVDFHPTDNQLAVLGELGAARYSESNGLAWTAATFNPPITNGGTAATDGRVELAYAPSNPSVVYASVNRNSGDVYRSTDGGQSYTRISTGLNYLGTQGWYDNTIWVNPQNENFVIVGGVFLYRSTNAGENNAIFNQVSVCVGGSIHNDHHIIVEHPGFDNIFNRTIFGGNDGGIYRANVGTLCGSSGWTELNNELGITQFYGAAGNPASGRIVGGTQDNGTLRYTGLTEFWTFTANSDGGFVAADQTDANFFYGEKQNLEVFRSSDGGNSSTQITSGLGDYTGIGCTNCRTNFIAPIALDPNEPNRLLAGGWSLWRTNNARGAAAWTSIKNPTGGNSPISAISISPNNSDFIVVGHNNGDIFLNLLGTSDNPIPNWTKIDTAGLPNRMVMRLVFDPNRAPNWIYATFGSFSSDNVYVSRNLGASWTDITGTGATGLPNVPVRSLVFHPSNVNLLYVGTEVGIFTSEDAGVTWDLMNGGPANVSVDELFWMGGDLIAATHGRGIFRASGGLYVDCNWMGMQTGSFDQPFRTVNAAINALPANRYTPIWLKPCTYNESINTANNPGKRFEIRSLGGTAQVVGQ